jgi:Tat protein translocase TatB subunit
MLDIGISELLIILVVALIVLGPQKLPEIARKLGKGFAEFRRASEDLRRSILMEDETRQRPPFTDAFPTRAREKRDVRTGTEPPGSVPSPEPAPSAPEGGIEDPTAKNRDDG